MISANAFRHTIQSYRQKAVGRCGYVNWGCGIQGQGEPSAPKKQTWGSFFIPGATLRSAQPYEGRMPMVSSPRGEKQAGPEREVGGVTDTAVSTVCWLQRSHAKVRHFSTCIHSSLSSIQRGIITIQGQTPARQQHYRASEGTWLGRVLRAV